MDFFLFFWAWAEKCGGLFWENVRNFLILELELPFPEIQAIVFGADFFYFWGLGLKNTPGGPKVHYLKTKTFWKNRFLNKFYIIFQFPSVWVFISIHHIGRKIPLTVKFFLFSSKSSLIYPTSTGVPFLLCRRGLARTLSFKTLLEIW